MYLNDIPPHDLSAEFVVMGERRRVHEEAAKKLEASAIPSMLQHVTG